MMMEEKCDCAHEQAGQRRLDSLRPTGASTCVVRVQALSLVAVRNNPSPSHHKQQQGGTSIRLNLTRPTGDNLTERNGPTAFARCAARIGPSARKPLGYT
jgi:hypothetical protein